MIADQIDSKRCQQVFKSLLRIPVDFLDLIEVVFSKISLLSIAEFGRKLFREEVYFLERSLCLIK